MPLDGPSPTVHTEPMARNLVQTYQRLRESPFHQLFGIQQIPTSLQIEENLNGNSQPTNS